MNDLNPPSDRGASTDSTPRPRRASRALSTVIVLTVGLVLAETLIGTGTGLLGIPAEIGVGPVRVSPADLLIAVLAAATGCKIVVDRAWRRLRTGADLALLALVLAMVLSTVVNDVEAAVAGPAALAYLRGAVVFYALRVLDVSGGRVGAILALAGAAVAVNVGVALAQLAFGSDAYHAVGHDPGWAAQGRTQGLFAQPDQLGHVLGVALLGVTALLAVRERVGKGWWSAAVVSAVALASTFSWASLATALAGVLVIAVLARANRGRILAVGLVLLVCGAGAVAVRVGVGGPADSGGAAGATTATAADPALGRRPDLAAVLERLQNRPLLGGGLGSAEETSDGYHHRDGPVDASWLRLATETGLLGLITYLVWLFSTLRGLLVGSRRSGALTHPPALALWAVGAVAFTASVSMVSPALRNPALLVSLFAVLGSAWWARRRAVSVRAAASSAETAILPRIREAVGNMDETVILSREGIRAAGDPGRATSRPDSTT